MAIPMDTSSRTALGYYFLWFCMGGIQFPTGVCVCVCVCVAGPVCKGVRVSVCKV